MPRVCAALSVQYIYNLPAVFKMRDEQTELEVLSEIYALTSAKKNWQKLLALGSTLDRDLKRTLLWIWPSALDLQNVNGALNVLGIRTVLSVGCGSGLLEWLLSSAAKADLSIFGLERDPNWWRSKYAVRSFIPQHYVEEADSELSSEFLSNCCSGVAPCALLFCYFNNRNAFVDYLRVFKGKWLILIGPMPGIGIHADPNPIQPQLPEEWTSRKTIYLTEHNVVAIYEKLNT